MTPENPDAKITLAIPEQEPLKSEVAAIVEAAGLSKNVSIVIRDEEAALKEVRAGTLDFAAVSRETWSKFNDNARDQGDEPNRVNVFTAASRNTLLASKQLGWDGRINAGGAVIEAIRQRALAPV
jgi:hypothetical protein